MFFLIIMNVALIEVSCLIQIRSLSSFFSQDDRYITRQKYPFTWIMIDGMRREKAALYRSNSAKQGSE